MSWLSRIDDAHDLVWFGQGSGGSWSYRISRAGSGYRATETLEHDADPNGPAAPVTTTKSLDPAAAAADIATQIRQYGDPGVVAR
jgi:hypothetical protein